MLQPIWCPLHVYKFLYIAFTGFHFIVSYMVETTVQWICKNDPRLIHAHSVNFSFMYGSLNHIYWLSILYIFYSWLSYAHASANFQYSAQLVYYIYHVGLSFVLGGLKFVLFCKFVIMAIIWHTYIVSIKHLRVCFIMICLMWVIYTFHPRFSG